MKSIYRNLIFCLAASLLLAGTSFSLTITGTVKNATTGKPSAGDKVDLLALQQGMTVLASTRTDASGAFSFNVDDANAPHLVRVTHDGVSYFPSGGPLQPGATSTSVDVYDATSQVEGITTTVDVVRLQTDGSNLQAVQLMAVKNASNPPRALSGEKTYEFYLPPNAQLDQVLVESPGGMPVTTSATPEGKSGKYSFNYAIKPGETRFEVAYHLPYSGQATFSPKMTADVQHFVVMMPKSMTFAPRDGAKFSPMDDQNATVQVATNVTPSTNLAFDVSGSGVLQDDQQNAQAQGSANAQGSTMADNRPGGGLGPPTDAPDPLHSYRWVILGGLGIVLICGAVFVVSRSNQQAPSVPLVEVRPAMVAATAARPVSTGVAAKTPSPSSDKTSMLLEGLKEELFQLEVDKQQGRISDDEYETAKAALNQTLKRALSRTAG